MIEETTAASSGLSDYLLPVGVTLLIVTLIGIAVHLIKKGNPARIANPPPAAEPGRFNNPITGGILALVLILIVGGLCLIFVFTVKSVIWGLIMVTLGGLWWHFGEIKHKPADPREVGTIHVGGKLIKIPGTRWHNGIVIKGDIIGFPFWPVYLDTVKTDADSQSNGEKGEGWEFQVTSQDGYTFNCKLFMRGKPNTGDMDDFIQAGNSMKEVFTLSKGVAENATRLMVKDDPIRKLINGEAGIYSKLEGTIDHIFKSQSYGVDLDIARFAPIIDDELKNLLGGQVIEQLEKEREIRDRETMAEFARNYQRDLAQTWHPVPFDKLTPGQVTAIVAQLVNAGKILTLDECLDKMHKERQIREKRSNLNTYDFQGNVPSHFIVGGGKP